MTWRHSAWARSTWIQKNLQSWQAQTNNAITFLQASQVDSQNLPNPACSHHSLTSHSFSLQLHCSTFYFSLPPSLFLMLFILCTRPCSVAQACPTFFDPMDCSPPGSLSMEFSRQEYWSALPFPTPEDLPDPGIKLMSPALAGDFFTNCATWEAPVLMVPFT